MRMRTIVASVVGAALGVVGVRALLGPGTHGRAVLRRSSDRVARGARYLADRVGTASATGHGAGTRIRPCPAPCWPTASVRASVPSRPAWTCPTSTSRPTTTSACSMETWPPSSRPTSSRRPWPRCRASKASSHTCTWGCFPATPDPRTGRTTDLPPPPCASSYAAATGAGLDEEHAPVVLLETDVDLVGHPEQGQLAQHGPVRRRSSRPARRGPPGGSLGRVRTPPTRRRALTDEDPLQCAAGEGADGGSHRHGGQHGDEPVCPTRPIVGRQGQRGDRDHHAEQPGARCHPDPAT